ncbi:MAG: hypothetical protein U0Q12_24110 [Vicinamibacterales bacterium]
MEVLLVTITVLALVTAAAMATVAWHLFRDDRQRSEARTAALRASLDAAVGGSGDATSTGTGRAWRESGDPLERFPSQYGPASKSLEWRNTPSDADAMRSTPSAAEGPGAGVASVFAPRDDGADFTRRVVPAVAMGAALVVLALGSIVVLTRTAPTATSAAATPMAPLELISLTHAARNGSIAITGVVRNPPEGRPLSQVSAVAFFFGADGAFLGSERKPLDFTTVRPGDESPFVISTSLSSVARYRVSFRAGDDRPLPHVDRREKS